MMKTVAMLVAAAVILGIAGTGCAGIQKKAPTMGFGDVSIEGQFGRDSFEVVGPIEGTSTTDGYFFGIVEVIDGSNVKLFGMPLYEEKYAFQPGFDSIMVNFTGPSTAERAYYNALSKSADADAVFTKAYYSRMSGMFPLGWSETVTFTGKALKLKEDKK